MSVQTWPRHRCVPRRCAVTTRPIYPNCDGGPQAVRVGRHACARRRYGVHLRSRPSRCRPRVSPAGGGKRRATIDHDCSKILVLSTYDDDPWNVLRCGEALSAVLLECTMAGMATCALTPMTEMAESRNIVAQITGTVGQPQLLIRVGRSPAHEQHVEHTPRRPLTEVLEIRC
jgi:hypothetical protein